jgi:hypothetical protein
VQIVSSILCELAIFGIPICALFRGTITITQGGQSGKHGLSGFISGSQVYLTIYDTADSTDEQYYAEGTLAAASESITGSVRGRWGTAGSITLTKQ